MVRGKCRIFFTEREHGLVCGHCTTGNEWRNGLTAPLTAGETGWMRLCGSGSDRDGTTRTWDWKQAENLPPPGGGLLHPTENGSPFVGMVGCCRSRGNALRRRGPGTFCVPAALQPRSWASGGSIRIMPEREPVEEEVNLLSIGPTCMGQIECPPSLDYLPPLPPRGFPIAGPAAGILVWLY